MRQPTNHLGGETSPYLLQHAHNPVNWYPWSDEALRLAGEQDKPILLSIGYSSCHWCHVMERESFEDAETARLMNEHFVNIKVDREERPDLDAIYMDYVQMTTGQGGWPLTAFLTPDLVPFFAGTYFPPVAVQGRPAFRTVLLNVSDFYRTHKESIAEKREEIVRSLQRAGGVQLSNVRPSEPMLQEASDGCLRELDSRHGGFGSAPKFPNAMTLSFLLRWSHRSRQTESLEAVTLSLDAMARGGLYDQLGGGFHRYCVDERWLVPHFEKMLYDNALLARLYLEAYQATGNESYRKVVKETLVYVQRELTHSSGGFFSSEDADSEGEEGRFYVWTADETERILGKENAALFNDYFAVTQTGNWEGKNILYQRREIAGLSRQAEKAPEEIQEQLDACRVQLHEARQARERPFRDEKVIASWNGLMLTAFAEAAFVLKDETFRESAQKNADFLLSSMTSEKRLCRCWKDGKATLKGFLDDYAHVVEGLISLYELDGDVRWLDSAIELMTVQLQLYFDPQQNHFYFTSSEHETLLIRQKGFFDNPIPCGNSTTVRNLLKLTVLTGETEYHRIAENMLCGLTSAMTRFPQAFGGWLQAADFFLGPVKEMALIGPREGREKFLQAIRSRFLPNKVIVQAEDPDKELSGRLPLLTHRTALEGRATAYLCQDYVCLEPVTEVERLKELL